MFVEPRIGTRPEDIISTWEWACKGVLAERSIREEKSISGGFLSTKHTLMGFDIDTETGIIEVPPVKVMGTRAMILSDVYRPGSSIVQLRDIQVLRGLCHHWLTASLYWKLTLHGLDTILRFAGESDNYISFPEPDVWLAYWNISEVLRVTADGELRWNRLFRGEICQVVEVSKRFSGPRQVEEAEWITSDATMQQTATINWHRREFLTAAVDEVMRVFSGYRPNQTIISEEELVIEILGCALWGEIEGDRLVQFLGRGNANSYCWIHNGKARQGVARDMIAGFQLWIAHYGLEPIPFFLRTHRNITRDFSTRDSNGQISEWAPHRRFKRTSIPWRWVRFGELANLFTWAGKLPELVRYVVPGDAPRLNLVEWGGSSFTPLSVLGFMGQVGFSWKARAKKGEELLHAWRIKVWNEEPTHVLAGTAWSAESILDFQHDIGRSRPKMDLLMTPSEAESPDDAPLLWDTHLWLHGARMGDVVAGCWNLYIRGRKSLGQTTHPIATESAMAIQQASLRVDVKHQSVELLSTKAMGIEHSVGYLRFQGGSGEERPSQQSQLSPVSFPQSRLEWINWPLIETGNEPMRGISRGERLSALGAHDLCRLEAQTPVDEQNEELWRLTPRALWGKAPSEVPQEVHAQNAERRFSCGKLDDELGDKIRSFTAGGKHDLLLHHLNVQKFRFTNGRFPVVKTDRRGLGRRFDGLDNLRDTGDEIASSTIMGEISGIRSIHLIHGKPDFAKYNGRYNILLKALRRGVVPKQKHLFLLKF